MIPPFRSTVKHPRGVARH